MLPPLLVKRKRNRFKIEGERCRALVSNGNFAKYAAFETNKAAEIVPKFFPIVRKF
jgi:hypothetical protein